jgi:Domain of unknown function DUF11
MRGPRLGCLTVILAITAFLALVISGVMTGTVFQAVLTPAAHAAPSAAASQCEPLPAAASTATPSPSPAATAAAGAELCVSTEAGQDAVKAGQTATWSITVTAQGGSVPAVTVTLTTVPAGTGAAFTSACPSGSGTASCDLGDLATPVTPSSYLLQAQVTLPASSTAGTLTLTASATAATTPAMTTWPAAGQAITVTTPKATATPDPARTTAATTPAQPAATTPAAAQPATMPAAPTLAAIPTYPISTTIAPAENIATVLPLVTAAATTPAAPDPVITASQAANIQDVPAPASSPQAGTFSLTIGMSAQTAEILGIVILALVIVLAATRVTATELARSRHQAAPGSPRTRPRRQPRRMKLPRVPRLLRRQGPTRAERRAAREANWRRHLEGERKALPPPPPAP